jgi:hypothetical protein
MKPDIDDDKFVVYFAVGFILAGLAIMSLVS